MHTIGGMCTEKCALVMENLLVIFITSKRFTSTYNVFSVKPYQFLSGIHVRNQRNQNYDPSCPIQCRF